MKKELDVCKSLLTLAIVGQTKLWENKLKLRRYSAIRQRIDIYCTLPHLDRSVTDKYLFSSILF